MKPRKMPNFKPIQLPVNEVSPEYKAAFEKFRAWAGHDVYLGDADPFKGIKEDCFFMYYCFMERILDLDLSSVELSGSKVTYVAKVFGQNKPTKELKGCLKMSLIVDVEGYPWITGLSIVDLEVERYPDLESNLSTRAQFDRRKWTFDLTENARKIAAAVYFNRVGIIHDVDIWSLLDQFEAKAALHRQGYG